MPAVTHHQPHKRIESGTTFAISCGIVAAAIIAACVVWRFVIPEHRRNASRSKWNDGSVLTNRSRRRLKKAYPPHPAVRALLHKPSAAQILPTYDPRSQSPFPGGSTASAIESRSEDARARSTPLPVTGISSNGLFTPVRRSSTANDESKNKYHTVPRAGDAKHYADKSSDFGDAKDFILAVPEPLVLKPREAGRPPAVTRHLQKYGPFLSASPANSDRLLHPNKLFRAVERSEIRNSVCSSTSMRVDHRQSDAITALSANDMVGMVDRAIEETMVERDRKKDMNSFDTEKTLSAESSSLSHVQHANPTAMHRLRSYHSLTGGQSPKLARAGTLTRPKTPVDELRKLYNKQQKHADVPMQCLHPTGTLSTLVTNAEENSDPGSISTPATSPTLPPSHLSLLPTPLVPKGSFEPRSVRISDIFHGRAIGPAVSGDGNHSHITQPKSSGQQDAVSQSHHGFYNAGRRLTKPAPLELKPNLTVPRSSVSHPHRSFTEFSQSVFGPLVKSNGMRSRARASSMYSRDTHGFSMVNTPITPDFPTPASEASTDRYTTGNPFKSQESVKARIDEWTQRIEEGNTASHLPPLRQVSPFMKSSQSSIDNTIERIDAKNLPLISEPQEEVEVIESDENMKDDGHYAPGGATWI